MSTPSSSAGKPSVGIVSIGEMGLGIAKLLQSHDYTVLTVTAGRRQSTIDRIKAAQIISLPTDEAFVAESDIILSIVPPRDAVATARRILEASRSPTTTKQRAERNNLSPKYAHSLTYVDLNAISPKTAKTIAGIITAEASPAVLRRRSSSFGFISPSPDAKPLVIDPLDGGIIGPPPSPGEESASSSTSWKRPSLVISGPKLDSLLPSDLQATLNIRNVGQYIGTGSALKSCFAALSKGMASLAILSYTTAYNCGVLPALQQHLKEYAPATLTQVERALVGMPPKAYRWIDEMRQIGETFGDEGGFTAGLGGQAIFEGVAEVYRLVAEDTILGEERVEKRKRGRTSEDVAACVADGVRKKRREAVQGEMKT